MIVCDSEFVKEISNITGVDNILCNESMKTHTTLRIGGNADYFVMPRSNEGLRDVIKCAKKYGIEYYILGNGSNLLVADAGYRGMMIYTGRYFDKISYDGADKAGAACNTDADECVVYAQSGVRLSRLGNSLMERAYTGFEFAAGIPGTVGGAVVMNAGAYGGEIKDVIVAAEVLAKDGRIITLTKDELKLGYRTSIIASEGYVVLGAWFKLRRGDREQIKQRMKELAGLRKDKQPLEYPSAGSTFKRPEGYYAGKLISDAGLKGYRIGGAMVSDKHAGFVINVKDATAADFIALTDAVRDKVYDMYGVRLELEVKVIGQI